MKTSRRTHLLKVRLLPEEHRLLRARAADCGKGTSTFVREVALGKVPRARPRRLEQDAVYHLARIGNNLNQLTRAANTSRRVELSERLDRLLRAIERMIAKLS